MVLRMTHYDPKVIQTYANRLYTNANAIIVLVGLVFGLFGFAVGTAGDFQLVAGAVGLLVGVLVGMSLAFNLKLKAQLALCQMRIEANTAQLLSRGAPMGVANGGQPAPVFVPIGRG